MPLDDARAGSGEVARADPVVMEGYLRLSWHLQVHCRASARTAEQRAAGICHPPHTRQSTELCCQSIGARGGGHLPFPIALYQQDLPVGVHGRADGGYVLQTAPKQTSRASHRRDHGDLCHHQRRQPARWPAPDGCLNGRQNPVLPGIAQRDQRRNHCHHQQSGGAERKGAAIQPNPVIDVACEFAGIQDRRQDIDQPAGQHQPQRRSQAAQQQRLAGVLPQQMPASRAQRQSDSCLAAARFVIHQAKIGEVGGSHQQHQK